MFDLVEEWTKFGLRDGGGTMWPSGYLQSHLCDDCFQLALSALGVTFVISGPLKSHQWASYSSDCSVLRSWNGNGKVWQE